MDFIRPITEQNCRFHISLSIDRYSERSVASLCNTTDGETAIQFLEQYCNLNGIPKTVRTDKASAFTGRQFNNFCKNKIVKLIYGTPYIHNPTGLVELGEGTLKENILTNIKAGEPFGKALDLALNLMGRTRHTRLRKDKQSSRYSRKVTIRRRSGYQPKPAHHQTSGNNWPFQHRNRKTRRTIRITNLRQSKRLTKTNSTVRLKNPVNQTLITRIQQKGSTCHHSWSSRKKYRNRTKRTTNKPPKTLIAPSAGNAEGFSRNTGGNNTRPLTDYRT